MAEQNLPAMHKPHEFVKGSYQEVVYQHQDYPRAKYHADYVHIKKDGVEYPTTAYAVIVNNAEEDETLGPDWKNSPGEHGIITAPDVADIQRQKLEAARRSAHWKSALNLPQVDINEDHVNFLKSQGLPEIDTVAQVYKLLAGFTSQQMKSFTDEFNAWNRKQSKKKQ